MFYVYVLKSEKDSSLYIGDTDDLKRRLREHNNGLSKYTKNKIPWQIIYYEAYKNKYDALNREKNLKRFAKGFYQLKNRINNSISDL